MFSFIPEGTCSKKIDIVVKHNVIESVKFHGGCPGNLTGIGRLIHGMEVSEVIDRVEGIKCGSKNTSCPDQLAKALRIYLEKEKGDLSINPTTSLIFSN